MKGSGVSLSVVFEPLFPDAIVPTRATTRSAGLDLYVHLRNRRVAVRDEHGRPNERETGDGDDASVLLSPGETALLPLGFKATLPDGFEAQIRARSSWAFERGIMLPNAPGTIDADFPDEWRVMLKVCGKSEIVVKHGDRVAQAVLSRFEATTWVRGQVGVSTDRRGGFGSTG